MLMCPKVKFDEIMRLSRALQYELWFSDISDNFAHSFFSPLDCQVWITTFQDIAIMFNQMSDKKC